MKFFLQNRQNLVALGMLGMGLCALFGQDRSAELLAAYKSGFYPGVTRHADAILSESPQSPFVPQALVYKGESQFRMGLIDASLQTLEQAKALEKDNDALQSQRSFWVGRGWYAKQSYEKALPCFYESASRSRYLAEPDSVYAAALYYAGLTEYALKAYDKAIPLLEYVTANGKKYAVTDYASAATKLADAYNRTERFEDAKRLVQACDNPVLSDPARYTLQLAKGDAEVGLRQYREAYDTYCAVLSQAPARFSASAMQKAYTVSAEHRAQVQQEPGAVLAQAQERLTDYPELLAEFWTRLAIDSYQAGDTNKARDYFARAETGATPELRQTAALYRAEIAMQADAVDGIGVAQSTLVQSAAQTELKPGDALFGAFRASQARFAGLSADWTDCLSYANDALTHGEEAAKKVAVYWKALSLYQTGRYTDACRAIEETPTEDAAVRTLYARALAKAGNMTAADKQFALLERQSALDNDGKLDYARTLLHTGRLAAAEEQAAAATGAEAVYLQGLAAFNRRQWDKAASGMEQALQTEPRLSESYVAYAQFYAGYAQYRAGQYAKAYAHLSAFTAANQVHPLRYTALMTASRSAVQSGDYEKSFSLAEDAIAAATTEEQKQEAVVLSAGVYADAGRYDKALAVLMPHADGRTTFAYQCRYEMAQIYAQKKDYAAADKAYASLADERAAGTYAEEAAFRRGELQYAQEHYAEAVRLFENYTKKWSRGTFADAALYFQADALAKQGKTERAVLYFLQVDALPTQTTYRYNAEKNLVALYTEQGDYANALTYAEKLLAGYGEQARADGIAKTIDELHVLSSGSDVTLVKKEAEYEKAGKDKTEKGRMIGTELARLYASASDTRAKGIALAQTLLAKQGTPAESQYAAQNALLLAQYYRGNGENKRAADTYLTAAQYARAAGNDENAARALYGAVEAFDAAGLAGDAASTAASLASLYPTSSLNEAAQKIVRK